MKALEPIESDRAYRMALEELRRLWGARRGTAQHKRLKHLAILIEAYESSRWPIELPDPVDAIKFRMEQQDYSIGDLARILGTAGRAYPIRRTRDILTRRRKLTVDMMRKLRQSWGISGDVLLADNGVRRKAA